jgi:hypothetical protein
MADMKQFGALLIAAAACVGASAFAAEQQHNAINITGEIQIDAVRREGTTTFHRAEQAHNPSADQGVRGSTLSRDESSLIGTKVYLNFGFDLSTNAKAFVQLGGRGFGGNNADNTNRGAGTNAGGDSSFNARIRQAYVELHEVMVPGLGLKLGIQDMVKGLDRGDGNHFVMYSPGWGKHFQIRDGGRVERAFSTRSRGQNVPVNNSNGFDDLNWTDTGTFAWVATWEQKDLLSADLFYISLENDGQGVHGAHLWGAEAKIPLKMVNDKSLCTVHAFNVRDNTQFQSELATIGDRPGSGMNFWQYGFGADLRLQDAFDLYGEAAWQHGKFDQNIAKVGGGEFSASNSDAGIEKRQDAYAYYLGAKVNVPGAADFKPALDVQYASFSGDDDQHDSRNTGFINYGDNKSSIVVEENEYGIGLSNNYNVWRFKGSVDLAGLGSMSKGRKTPFTVAYHIFDVNADRVQNSLVPFPGADGARVQNELNPGDLGTELDFALAHEYSENVTFKLGYGIFFPGMYVRENANLSPQLMNGVPQARGTAGKTAGDGASAQVMIFTTSVKF